MWVPVLESKTWSGAPVQVKYWGAPVVLFRTPSGALGALEDACAHRGVPLSRGLVRGESIRCGYHHFSFDVEGRCVSIPRLFSVDESFQRSCSVRRFFVREALGLVWISVEDEPAAPFPVDVLGSPADAAVASGFFPLTGDVRVWMDHFLDLPHGVYVHARSLFGGSHDSPPDLASSSSVEITPSTQFPVERWLTFEFASKETSPLAKLYRPALSLLLLGAGAGAMRPDRVRVTVDLIAPFCQKYRLDAWSGLGDHSIEYWTAVAPVSRGELVFAYAGYFSATAFWGARRRGALVRHLQQLALRLFLRRHIGGEDDRFLGSADFVETERMRVTPLDESIVAMRAMLSRHAREKAHLFPRGSLMHELYGA